MNRHPHSLGSLALMCLVAVAALMLPASLRGDTVNILLTGLPDGSVEISGDVLQSGCFQRSLAGFPDWVECLKVFMPGPFSPTDTPLFELPSAFSAPGSDQPLYSTAPIVGLPTDCAPDCEPEFEGFNIVGGANPDLGNSCANYFLGVNPGGCYPVVDGEVHDLGTFYGVDFSFQAEAPTPEPASAILVASGCALLARRRRRLSK